MSQFAAVPLCYLFFAGSSDCLFFCCQGIGRQLFGEAYKKALEEGYSFMQVKTVKMSVYKRILARFM